MLSERLEGERRVLPFVVPPSRRAMRRVEEAGDRGRVLVFTGVRYSRPAEAADAGNAEVTGMERPRTAS